MNLTKKVLCVALVTLGLSACDEGVKSESWYLEHHDALIKKYGECLKTQTFQSKECVPVVNARNKAKGETDIEDGIKKVKTEWLKTRKTEPVADLNSDLPSDSLFKTKKE